MGQPSAPSLRPPLLQPPVPPLPGGEISAAPASCGKCSLRSSPVVSNSLRTLTPTQPRTATLTPTHSFFVDWDFFLSRVFLRIFCVHTGMRRPSWNKSQAIQQVIALKSLLEPPPPSPPADLPRLTSASPQLLLPKATALSPSEIPTPHVRRSNALLMLLLLLAFYSHTKPFEEFISHVQTARQLKKLGILIEEI